MKNTFILLFLLLSGILQAQMSDNMTLLDTWSDPTLVTHSGLIYNDCWGYTAPDGREYAILGSAEMIHFIDITDPTDVTEVARFDNLNVNGTTGRSLWRDFKTHDEYAYAVADQQTEGLIVFDLSDLPNSVSKVHQSTASFTQAHNIYIDEAKDRIYIPGSDTHGGGIIVFDISPANAAAPVEIGAPNMTGGYSHDIHVRNDTAYCFHGNNNTVKFGVYDFSDAQNPVLLGSMPTYANQGYNHSGWLTEDSQFMIFCDESTGREVKVADLTDLTDITAPASAFFNANLDGDTPLNNIAHNPFVKGDYVYVAYYNEGVQVWDVSDPLNAVLEGYYDTVPSTTAGNFDGVWGVFPYFDSETVIASDTETGLYVLRVNSILPVELTRFTAALNEGKAELNWRTEFEQDNDFFAVEHSTDGNEFKEIGTVKGNGTVSAPIDYAFTHDNPQDGDNYYRLKQTDFDGSFEYSKVRRVRLNSDMQVKVYPTLLAAGESLTVDFSDKSSFDRSYRLVDAAGKTLRSGEISAVETSFTMQTENLPAGVYFAEIQAGNRTLTKRFIIK